MRYARTLRLDRHDNIIFTTMVKMQSVGCPATALTGSVYATSLTALHRSLLRPPLLLPRREDETLP